MNRFWDVLIEPILGALRPRTIIEIGCQTGKNTKNILEFCVATGATLHAIDPAPQFDVNAWEEVYGSCFVFHRSLSLNALPLIGAADAVLIDGDHNWYTVINELRLLDRAASRAGTPFPMVFLHDVGWPYGRRDMYYDPETIPDAYRQPYRKLGLRLGSPEVDPYAGFNSHLNHSIYEDTLQNGVRTAVEDFCRETNRALQFVFIPGLFGLGLLFEPSVVQQSPELTRLIGELSIPQSLFRVMEAVEANRLSLEEQLAEHRATLERLSAQNSALQEQRKADVERASRLEEALRHAQTEAAALEKESAEAYRLLAEVRSELDSLRSEKNALTEALGRRTADLDRTSHELESSRRQLADALTQLKEAQRRADAVCAGELAEVRAQLHATEAALAELRGRYAEGLRLVQQIEKAFKALLESRRWRVGNALGELRRHILRRPPETGAVEYIQSILQRFAALQQMQEQERAKPTGRPLSTGAATVANSKPTPPAKAVIRVPKVPSGRPVTTGEQVTAIVLNRNGAQHLQNLFASVVEHNTYQNLHFIVVDHASEDNSLEVIQAYQGHLSIELVALDQNHSYSYSNNLAARRASGKYLLFLNNDIIFTSDAIPRLVERIEREKVGVVGTALFYPRWNERYPEQIQHAGIAFADDAQYRFMRPYNIGAKVGVTELPSPAVVPAVTGAVLLCRREEFLAIGGFCEEYNYGYEDVDLCLTYRSKLNKNSWVATDIALVHDESATQKRDTASATRERRLSNIKVLQERYGYGIKRAFMADLIKGTRFWCRDELVIAFAVTEASADAKAGDYFTALELASACRDEFGWRPVFLARNQDWYDLTNVDILVAMVDAYDLTQIRNAKPTLIRVAWMRNWFDRWVTRPCFEQYDLYLCSSAYAAEFIRNTHHKNAHVFRIATNPERFKAGSVDPRVASDYCFTGSYWGAARDVEMTLQPENRSYKLAIYGNGWDGHKRLRRYWRGFLPYAELPKVYASTKIVIDDANHVTKPWGSVNSRVFDALAAGALVITNGELGSQETFGGLLPTYRDAGEFQSLLDRYLNDEDGRKALVAQLRQEVLQNHTYQKRAHQLREILLDYCTNRYRIAIKVPAPSHAVAHEWGDYHFALALRRSLVKAGHTVRIDLLPDWDTALGHGDDVVIVLRGLSAYKPDPRHINLMWNISHPDRVTVEEYNQYDHVFVASLSYARELQKRVRCPVTPLLQCTDPDVFYPEVADEVPAHDLLFVGNSRNQYRTAVKASIEANLPIAVYGSRWEGLIPAEYIKGVHIPNAELRRYYSCAKIVLNDHWETMRRFGFVSNRVFDAGACGAFVISDDVSGVHDIFGEAVVTFSNAEEFKTLVNRYLADETERRRHGDRLRAMVLERHTFQHRAEEILRVIEQLDRERRKNLA